MKDYITLKDGKYITIKDFDLHVPKRCVEDIKVSPVVVLFGKIYTSDNKAFDLIQFNATPTRFSTYEEASDRYILHYKEGDMFCMEKLVMTISNVEVIFNILSFGQVLPDMEYESVYHALMNSVNNNAKLDVPVYFYEYTVAALIRDAKDTSKPIRQTNPNGPFRNCSISQINMSGDAFVAVTSVDPETMIISAMNASKDAAKSPAQKTFLL